MSEHGAGERDFHLRFQDEMDALAGAEARLFAAPAGLAPQEREMFAGLILDATSALLMLRARPAGDMDHATFQREAGRLRLDPVLKPQLLARMPQPARIGALALHDLASRLSAGLAACLAAAGQEGRAPAGRTHEKPRRRQGRPRLHLVARGVADNPT